MNLNELTAYKATLKISIDKIVREEAEMAFLQELADDPLSSKLVFYGGTALRLAYNSPRFSAPNCRFQNRQGFWSQSKNYP